MSNAAAQRLQELEKIIAEAMEMCASKNCSKAEVLDVLASADIDLTRNYEDDDELDADTLDEDEYKYWYAQERENTMCVACGDD